MVFDVRRGTVDTTNKPVRGCTVVWMCWVSGMAWLGGRCCRLSSVVFKEPRASTTEHNKWVMCSISEKAFFEEKMSSLSKNSS